LLVECPVVAECVLVVEVLVFALPVFVVEEGFFAAEDVSVCEAAKPCKPKQSTRESMVLCQPQRRIGVMQYIFS
jgi:hypothetical protein